MRACVVVCLCVYMVLMELHLCIGMHVDSRGVGGRGIRGEGRRPTGGRVSAVTMFRVSCGSVFLAGVK